MSLQTKILNLIGGITDPLHRMGISSTISFLYQAFASGSAREDEIRDTLYELFQDVLRFKNPELLDEEVKAKARELVEEFILAFRMESISRRVFAKFRPRLFRPT